MRHLATGANRRHTPAARQTPPEGLRDPRWQYA